MVPKIVMLELPLLMPFLLHSQQCQSTDKKQHTIVLNVIYKNKSNKQYSAKVPMTIHLLKEQRTGKMSQ